MKKYKSIISSVAAFLAAALAAALILPIAACGPEESGNNTIFVTSAGGMALKNVSVEVSSGSGSLGAKVTDDEGKVVYDLDGSQSYTVVLSDLPVGFEYEDSYTIKGSDATSYIRLNSHVIEGGVPARNYVLGDVMYDFEQTYYTLSSDGNMTSRRVKLSELLNTGAKKAVVINFWFSTCNPCIQEIPAIKNAYTKYADKIEVLGVNDYSQDALSDVQSFMRTYNVNYPMCKDTASLGTNFTKAGWPFTVMIDRYGIIGDILFGTEPDSGFWDNWFQRYTSDDYSQNITPGDTGSEDFVPDKPEDFNAVMPDTQTISQYINKTDRSIVFSEDETKTSEGGKYCWPWTLTEDNSAIYPTNSGHYSTMANIYAQINLEKDEVFAFDYKLSTLTGYNNFYVSIDSRMGTGRQISVESGVHDWKNGYAYVALEAGQHEICFTYYKTTATTSLDLEDKVYIKNLRIMSVADMNADLTSRSETFEMPYFATREYDTSSKQFKVKEGVYLASDGYYHVGSKQNNQPAGSDPYLFVDFTHSSPFYGSNSNSLYVTFNEYTNGMVINGVDYTEKFSSYILYSGNSDYNGMVPVTDEMKNMLTAIYNDKTPSFAPYYDKTGEGWKQFCLYYKQYGTQKELSDPIKGLAYFSAFTAHETTDIKENYVPSDGTGQFSLMDGKFVDVEGTSKKDEGTYNWNAGLNIVNFDRIIMPRGLVFKFIPKESAVYRIQGLECNYFNDQDKVVHTEGTSADLFDENLTVSTVYGDELTAYNADTMIRGENMDVFTMYYYLEANKQYYISVMFNVVETTGEFAFRIDNIGQKFEYLSPATLGTYGLDENNHLTVPVLVDAEYDTSKQYYVDKKTGEPIYLDLTEYTHLFSALTIEEILDTDINKTQLTFDMTKDKVVIGGVEYDISIDKDNLPAGLTKEDVVDYTGIMENYLDNATKDKNKDDWDYGLVPVNEELHKILQLYILKFMGYDSDDEWLRACWYKVKLGPSA